MDRNATVFTISALVALAALFVFILYIFSDSRSSLFGTVTQTGLATDAVTLNKRMGVITTITQNIPSGGSVEFTVNNTLSKIASVLLVAVQYSGSGLPVITTSDIADGSFKIKISNTSLVSLTSPVKIHYRVL